MAKFNLLESGFGNQLLRNSKGLVRFASFADDDMDLVYLGDCIDGKIVWDTEAKIDLDSSEWKMILHSTYIGNPYLSNKEIFTEVYTRQFQNSIVQNPNLHQYVKKEGFSLQVCVSKMVEAISTTGASLTGLAIEATLKELRLKPQPRVLGDWINALTPQEVLDIIQDETSKRYGHLDKSMQESLVIAGWENAIAKFKEIRRYPWAHHQERNSQESQFFEWKDIHRGRSTAFSELMSLYKDTPQGLSGSIAT